MQITGQITDKKDGSPLYGAHVVVVDQNGKAINRPSGGVIGTSTGPNGYFDLFDAPATGLLKISYIGYAAVTVPIKSSVFVQLESGHQADEVVITGKKQTGKSYAWIGWALLAAIGIKVLKGESNE